VDQRILNLGRGVVPTVFWGRTIARDRCSHRTAPSPEPDGWLVRHQKIEKAATRYQKITNPSELKKQGIKKFISQESLKSLPLATCLLSSGWPVQDPSMVDPGPWRECSPGDNCF